MKQRKNIVLVGYMGSGKTSLGLRLSYKLHMSVEDTDKIIERRAGKSISTIFEEEGEEAFRRMETELLASLIEKKGGHLYSLGGGTPMREENRELIKKLGIVVYLRIKPETVYKRLKNDTTRPLLQTEDPLNKISQMLEQRGPVYESIADFTIDVDELSQQEISYQIMNYVNSLSVAPVNHRQTNSENLIQAEGGSSQLSTDESSSQQAVNESVQQDAQPKPQLEEQVPIQNRPKTKLLVINGPNLNFLGIREKAIYGNQDYNYLVQLIQDKAKESSCAIECYQSNHEGAIIDRIQAAYFDGTEGIVINPGAYTHYSYAIHDALASVTTIPKVEIHISDITSREEFRKTSVTAPACDKQIYGHGLPGYIEAIDYILEKKVEK